jgi:TetR/AcrR family transcriptional repressor of nem operon
MYAAVVDAAERLVESAQELLWERGYVGTSPKAIQLRAGAGQGSMYHHFAGKSQLALAAMRRSAAQLRAQAEEQFDALGSPYERIAAYLLRERDALRGCRIGRMTQDPDVIADPQLRAPLEETFGWLCGRIAVLLREAGHPAADDVAAALVAVVQGGYVLARAAGDVEPFERAVRGALRLLEAGRG